MKRYLLTSTLIGTIIILYSCKDKVTENVSELEWEPQEFTQLIETEETLRDLAEVLPEALIDPSLARIVWQECKRNEPDEPYAFWSKIADVPTTTGITLRSKIQNIKFKRSSGKTSVHGQSFTSSLDEIDYLQVYIHDFEDWDSSSALPATYTPLTIDDLDVIELVLFDTLGNMDLLDVSDRNWEPNYPVAIVGLNESALFQGQVDSTTNGNAKVSLVSTSEGVFCKKIHVRKVRDLESWFAGKAEMVVRQIDSDCGGLFVNAPVRNSGKKAKKCKYKKSGRFCLWNGTLRGDVQLTKTERSVTFEVFEVDVIFDDWVVNEATVSYPSWSITTKDKGEHYKCGNYTRCTYDWGWGSDASYQYDCMEDN